MALHHTVENAGGQQSPLDGVDGFSLSNRLFDRPQQVGEVAKRGIFLHLEPRGNRLGSSLQLEGTAKLTDRSIRHH
ncbi:MAG: hypothetical protein ACK55I_23815, partial [bacterium]